MTGAAPRPGRFITLEGGEGVGKSTQIKALAHALRQRGHRVVTTREPGGSPGAEQIRALLLDPNGTDWSAPAEALLFAAARADHVERVIAPALARGEWVLCDRFVDSTRVYQAVRDGSALMDADIMALHRIGSGGLLPDRTFVLQVSTETAAVRRSARDGGGGDRFEQRHVEFHRAVAQGFHRLAVAEPGRMRLVSADAPADMVTAALLEQLEDLL